MSACARSKRGKGSPEVRIGGMFGLAELTRRVCASLTVPTTPSPIPPVSVTSAADAWLARGTFARRAMSPPWANWEGGCAQRGPQSAAAASPPSNNTAPQPQARFLIRLTFELSPHVSHNGCHVNSLPVAMESAIDVDREIVRGNEPVG
jgi:hypothetical protein